MDFETFLKSEAMRPLSSVFARTLMDSPDTAAIIARLPPPRIAMLYHAALMQDQLTDADQVGPDAAERLSGRVLAAYGLPNGATRASAAAQSATAMPYLLVPPLCLDHVHHHRMAFQHLEHAMALREVELQQTIVESLLRCAQSTPPTYSASQHDCDETDEG